MIRVIAFIVACVIACKAYAIPQVYATTGQTIYIHILVDTSPMVYVHYQLVEDPTGVYTLNPQDAIDDGLANWLSSSDVFPTGYQWTANTQASNSYPATWSGGEFRWSSSSEIPIGHEVWTYVTRVLTSGGGGGGNPLLTVSAPPLSIVPRTGSKKVRFSFVCVDDEGALVDPSSNTITIAYTDPDGGTVPSGLPTTATRISAGRYYFEITVLSTFTTSQKLVMTATATVDSVAKVTVFNTQFMPTPPASITIGGQ